MMLVVPLQPTASQLVNVNLGGQACQIRVSQKNTGMFVDLYVNNVLIIGGVLAENRNRIVRSLYLGFQGDLTFYDNEGQTDPYYTGLGSRYSLLYLTAAEVVVATGGT